MTDQDRIPYFMKFNEKWPYDQYLGQMSHVPESEVNREDSLSGGISERDYVSHLLKNSDPFERAGYRNATRGGGEGYKSNYTPEQREQQQHNALQGMALIASFPTMSQGALHLASRLPWMPSMGGVAGTIPEATLPTAISGNISAADIANQGDYKNAARLALSSAIPYGLGKSGFGWGTIGLSDLGLQSAYFPWQGFGSDVAKLLKNNAAPFQDPLTNSMPLP